MYISQVFRSSKLYNIPPTHINESHNFSHWMNLNTKSLKRSSNIQIHTTSSYFQYPTPHRPPAGPSRLKSRAHEIAGVFHPLSFAISHANHAQSRLNVISFPYATIVLEKVFGGRSRSGQILLSKYQGKRIKQFNGTWKIFAKLVSYTLLVKFVILLQRWTGRSDVYKLGRIQQF